jgi:hypothetical protein
VPAPGSWLAPQRASGGRSGRSGGSYELLDDTAPTPLPTWLHQALSTNRPMATSAPSEQVTVTPRSPGRYVAAVLRDELERVHRAGRGGGLSMAEAEAVLTRAAAQIAAGPCDCTTRDLPRAPHPARAVTPGRGSPPLRVIGGAR